MEVFFKSVQNTFLDLWPLSHRVFVDIMEAMDLMWVWKTSIILILKNKAHTCFNQTSAHIINNTFIIIYICNLDLVLVVHFMVSVPTSKFTANSYLWYKIKHKIEYLCRNRSRGLKKRSESVFQPSSNHFGHSRLVQFCPKLT